MLCIDSHWHDLLLPIVLQIMPCMDKHIMYSQTSPIILNMRSLSYNVKKETDHAA